MNRRVQKAELLNNKANMIKNTDDLNIINLKERNDFKKSNKLKCTIDMKSINKKERSDLKKYKNISDSKNCKLKDLDDSKINEKLKYKGDINYKIKDRGDLKVVLKPNEGRMKKDEVVKRKIINPDGDTQKVSVNQRPETFKIIESTKQSNLKNSECTKSFWNKRTVVRNAQALATVDLKRIRDRYTMKLRDPSRPTLVPKKEENSTKTEPKNVSIKKESKGGSIHIKEQLPHASQKNQNLPQKIPISPHITQKIHDHVLQKVSDLPRVTQKHKEYITQKNQDLPQIEQKTQDLPQVVQNAHDLPVTKANEKEARKKPVVRTVMSKNGSTRIYKAVTFEEHKGKPTTLEINIPTDSFKKPNSIKSIDVNSLKSKVTVSKISVKEKKVIPKKCCQKRDRKHRIHLPSRDCSVQDMLARSPETEVAKWAPTSITPQTKPYYEAWVDTTLTAVSKSERSKSEKISMLKCLQQALERPDTPELFYCNYADERYAGRIKIHTRYHMWFYCN